MAASQPRTPNSPPLLPTSTFPITTSGAIVVVSPLLMSPTRSFHSSLPVAASRAIVCASSVLKISFPSHSAGPRFTTSQQATPCAAEVGRGLYIHLGGPPGLRRSNAYASFGYGVTTYIVSPATSGAASCPLAIPV